MQVPLLHPFLLAAGSGAREMRADRVHGTPADWPTSAERLHDAHPAAATGDDLSQLARGQAAPSLGGAAAVSLWERAQVETVMALGVGQAAF